MVYPTWLKDQTGQCEVLHLKLGVKLKGVTLDGKQVKPDPKLKCAGQSLKPFPGEEAINSKAKHGSR